MADRPANFSLPDKQRDRPRAGWTIHRAVIAAADAAALEAGEPSTSAWVERALAERLQIPVPPPPERGRRKT